MAESIEDIILDHDKRGMLALRPHLPPDFCSQAAQFVIEKTGGVIIVTGFYVVMAGKPETDGPPGAIAIGQALKALARQVTYDQVPHRLIGCFSRNLTYANQTSPDNIGMLAGNPLHEDAITIGVESDRIGAECDAWIRSQPKT